MYNPETLKARVRDLSLITLGAAAVWLGGHAVADALHMDGVAKEHNPAAWILEGLQTTPPRLSGLTDAIISAELGATTLVLRSATRDLF